MTRKNYLKVDIGERYVLLQLSQVTSILSMVQLSPGMGHQSLLLGMMNYHGTSVPVYDLQYLVAHSKTSIDKDKFIILCEIGQQPVGFVTQNVQGIFKTTVTNSISPFVKLDSFVTSTIENEDGIHWIIDMMDMLKFYDLFDQTKVDE